MPFDRQDQHALSTGCAKVVYVREYKGVQGSTREYRGVQGSAEGVQGQGVHLILKEGFARCLNYIRGLALTGLILLTER